jgi:hypothetical protein
VRATLWPARPPQTDFRKAQTKRAVRSRLFGWREILCQSDGACERIATSSNETRRRAVESRFSVGKKKKRHLFFDENAVGAD